MRCSDRQLIILRRKVRGRVHLTNGDRLSLVQLYRWFPSVLKTITIIRPETLVRRHRAGFRRYWRWKSRSLGGRPQVDADLRALIQRMSVDNPLWGARVSMAGCSSSARASGGTETSERLIYLVGLCAAHIWCFEVRPVSLLPRSNSLFLEKNYTRSWIRSATNAGSRSAWFPPNDIRSSSSGPQRSRFGSNPAGGRSQRPSFPC